MSQEPGGKAIQRRIGGVLESRTATVEKDIMRDIIDRGDVFRPDRQHRGYRGSDHYSGRWWKRASMVRYRSCAIRTLVLFVVHPIAIAVGDRTAMITGQASD